MKLNIQLVQLNECDFRKGDGKDLLEKKIRNM